MSTSATARGGNGALVIGGVDCAQGLPRGRHGIPRELVDANQCERQLVATAALISERGYASLRVGDITARAGVSRATFYKFFDDKFDALLATQRWALEGLDDAVRLGCAGASEWPLQVAAAVAAATRFCLDSPERARFLFATAFADLEPRLAREGVALPQHMLELLREGAERQPASRSPDPLIAEAAVCAAISLAAAAIRAGDCEALLRLQPDLTETLLAPHLGDEEAKRVALAAV